MKTPIKSFEIIKEMYEYFVKKYRDLEPKLMICEKEDFDNVETTLRESSELRTRNYELLKESEQFYNERNKYKKAVKIIKEKGLHYLEVSLIQSCSSYKDYYVEMKITINTRPMIDSKIKTEEEYELLKEVLK